MATEGKRVAVVIIIRQTEVSDIEDEGKGALGNDYKA